MEKSIKRVEKLVHATSSALAQMKFSLMFDDMNEGKKSPAEKGVDGLDAALLEKFLESDDLNLKQNEFKVEASEALAKVDNILAPNEFNGKCLKPIDRIKDINKKMSHLKLEHSKREETKQSRQKLLSLIGEEKFSPGTTSYKGYILRKQLPCFNDKRELLGKSRSVSESVSTAIKSPMKPETELKSSILETQVIVDKGFETARQLAQKVESLTKWDKKDRTPSSVKTFSEINLKSSGEKTESSETIKSVKCRRCSGRKIKRETDFQEVEKINNRVIRIKRNEFKRKARINLQQQQLPSLHIRGGLKVQKIHNLEIPASEKVFSGKRNIAISFFSHEQMKREKIEKILEKVRKENFIWFKDQRGTNYVECFNCGKLISVRKTWVDPRRIDEVLRECDFNVFDPRIDEFVEKYKGAGTSVRCEETPPEAISQSNALSAKNADELPQTNVRRKPRKRTNFTLRDFSDQLCKKYKDEADALVDNHSKLDAILRNLFRKVEESKEAFEASYLLRNCKLDSERASMLSATKPVLITLPRVSSFVKNRERKSDKRGVKNRGKSRTEFLDEEEILVQKQTPCEYSPAVSPSVQLKSDKKFLFESKKEAQERFVLPTVWESVTTKDLDIKKEEDEESPFVTSLTRHSDSSSCEPDSGSKEKKKRKTPLKTFLQRKNTDPLRDNSFVELYTIKCKTSKALGNKKEGMGGEELPSEASLTSFSKVAATAHTDFLKENTGEPKCFSESLAQLGGLKPSFKDPERRVLAVSSSKSSIVDRDEEEIEEPCQTPSEKSENNYESDFESFTNEPEEKRDDSENLERDTNLFPKKLSTISEVDSERDKKLSDHQNIQLEDGIVKYVNEKVVNSLDSVASGKTKQTEVTPTRTSEVSPKSNQTELVTSLRDILTALQDQCARTESLAEKLTESSKVERREKPDLVKGSVADPILNSWKITTPNQLVENLRSLRKDWNPRLKGNFLIGLPEKPKSGRSKIPVGLSSGDGASEEGGSSLGEIIVSGGRKRNSVASSISSISEESFLGLVSED